MSRHLRPALRLLIAATIGVSLLPPALAQEKKLLTFDQLFRNGQPRLTKSLPVVTGWTDDEHFVETLQREAGEGGTGRMIATSNGAPVGRRADEPMAGGRAA